MKNGVVDNLRISVALRKVVLLFGIHKSSFSRDFFFGGSSASGKCTWGALNKAYKAASSPREEMAPHGDTCIALSLCSDTPPGSGRSRLSSGTRA